MVEAVIFDMDGLLIDSEPFWVETEMRIFNALGLNLNESDCANTAGLRIDEVVDHWFSQRPWEGRTRQEVEADIVEGVKSCILEKGELLPGVLESLSFLKHLEIPMALASSSKMDLINASIDRLDIRKYFDLVHSAEFEKKGKPHPDIFLTCKKRLKVSSRGCLVLEDSAAGATAAKRAMMPFVAVPNASPADAPIFFESEVILDSLEQFPEWFTAYLSSQ